MNEVEELSQYQTPQPPAPEPLPVTPPPQHRWGILAGFAAIAVAISAGAYFFLSEKYAADPVIPTYTPRTSVDPMADWKVYNYTTDLEMNFQIRYPSDWADAVPNEKPIVYLRKSATDQTTGIEISLGYYPQLLTLDSWLASQKWPLAPGETVNDIFSPFGNIDGYPAVIQKPTGTVYAVTDHLVLTAQNGTGFNRNQVPEDLFRQILSTFKFTSTTTDTSTWKTYMNGNMGYAFKYPAQLKFIDEDCTVTNDKYSCYHRIERTAINEFSVIIQVNPSDQGGIPITNTTKGTIRIGDSEITYTLGDEKQMGSDILMGNKVMLLNLSRGIYFTARFKNTADQQLAESILSTFKFTK